MSELAEHVVMVEDERPVPIRYWWLKRLALAGVVLVLGLVALRLWWGYEAQRRLDVVIAGYRAAGQMVDAAEFDAVLDAVPDEDNAAILYEEAIGKLVITSTSGVSYEEFNDDRSLFETKSADALELVSLNAEVIALVRAAQSRKQVAWSDRLNVNPLAANMTIIWRQRKLAKFLWFGANYHMQRGEYSESLQYIQDLWLFSDAIIEHPKTISFLIGVGCHWMVSTSLEELIGELDKPDMPIAPEVQFQIRQFIRMAQKESKFRESVENANLGERDYSLRMLNNISSNPAIAGIGAYSWDAVLTDFIARPVLLLDSLQIMELHSEAARSVYAPTWRSALLVIHRDDAETNLLSNLSHPFSNSAMVSYSKNIYGSMRIFFRQLAQRRMVAAGLAVKLFEIERGRWPVSLDELVPDYLPEVPLDPFAGEDDPLRYIVEDDRVLLYSIDEDGDNGGEKWNGKTQTGDRAFYLNGKPEERAIK